MQFTPQKYASTTGMNWISNKKPAQGFPINILIPKAKHVNQDLRRFSGNIPIIFDGLKIFFKSQKS